MVNIKVVTQGLSALYFKSRVSTRLDKLMNAFCNRHGYTASSLRFLFDGKRIYGTQTPEELDMADGDVIDVIAATSAAAATEAATTPVMADDDDDDDDDEEEEEEMEVAVGDDGSTDDGRLASAAAPQTTATPNQSDGSGAPALKAPLSVLSHYRGVELFLSSSNNTGYRGVAFRPRAKEKAYEVSYKQKSRGYFHTAEEGALVYFFLVEADKEKEAAERRAKVAAADAAACGEQLGVDEREASGERGAFSSQFTPTSCTAVAATMTLPLVAPLFVPMALALPLEHASPPAVAQRMARLMGEVERCGGDVELLRGWSCRIASMVPMFTSADGVTHRGFAAAIRHLPIGPAGAGSDVVEEDEGAVSEEEAGEAEGLFD